MSINKEHLKELESFDPDDLVGILGISSEQLLRAFPGHAYDYIRDNFGIPKNEDDGQLDLFADIERHVDEPYEPPEEDT